MSPRTLRDFLSPYACTKLCVFWWSSFFFRVRWFFRLLCLCANSSLRVFDILVFCNLVASCSQVIVVVRICAPTGSSFHQHCQCGCLKLEDLQSSFGEHSFFCPRLLRAIDAHAVLTDPIRVSCCQPASVRTCGRCFVEAMQKGTSNVKNNKIPPQAFSKAGIWRVEERSASDTNCPPARHSCQPET